LTCRNLLKHLEPRLGAYVSELRELCAIESPTNYKPGVDEAGDWVQRFASARGWDVRVWRDAEVGDSLVVTVSGGSPDGLLALLAAHLDTVYPVGVASERPLMEDADRLVGPGSADNKSGLLSGLYALAALQELDLLAPFAAATLVCGADEEAGMLSSSRLLEEVAPAYDLAFVLEAGRENGDIVSARKGNGQFIVEVRGREAHAGVEPEKGANAIVALAGQILELQELNGRPAGTTVSVGVIEGGTVPNVVPGLARALVDVRVAHAEDMVAVSEALERIAGNPGVAGTTGRLLGGWRKMPMPRTAQTAGLAELAIESARELGFSVKDAATGGVSYANVLAGLGLPVLDGLGPVGGLDHSPNEYILRSSIAPRTALLALLLLRSAEDASLRASRKPRSKLMDAAKQIR
jgi:glutamate carboxypeptidase